MLDRSHGRIVEPSIGDDIRLLWRLVRGAHSGQVWSCSLPRARVESLAIG